MGEPLAASVFPLMEEDVMPGRHRPSRIKGAGMRTSLLRKGDAS